MAVRKTQDQYVQELVQENKRIHYMAYALIVLLIAVIVVSVLKQFMLTSILLVVAILYQIFVVRKQQRAYLKKCENTNLELSTLKDFSDTEIEEKGTQLSEQDLEAAGLLPFVPKTASFSNPFMERRESSRSARRTAPSHSTSMKRALPLTSIPATGSVFDSRNPPD